MGQEIVDSHFTEQDFVVFSEKLRQETELLKDWFEQSRFSERDQVGGFELEAWLVDEAYHPALINDPYLKRLNDPLVVPELARFNVELNTQPEALHGAVLSRMAKNLQQRWSRCELVAQEFSSHLLMIGILPTLDDGCLNADSMSGLKRYQALDEQVLKQRGGRPISLDISGREHLKIEHQNVMLESATTSFQIHLKVAPACAAKFYNAAMILSAPMVAVSANSPYLFGKDLWDETRIPLFEQAVQVGGFADAAQGPVRRVGFGSGYVEASLLECFRENAQHFPVLLPMVMDEVPEKFAHLRLHNGTIWRWNRPLIGFDDDGTPHLRIEHRVVPGGPSVLDSVANAAFFFGLMQFLGSCEVLTELNMPFAQARDNFYAAARKGLDAQITWTDGQKGSVQSLILDKLLPMARTGLEQLGIDEGDIILYTGIIKTRAKSACNGAAWQRAFVAHHGLDMAQMTAAYHQRQDSGLAVHEWDING